ncbi:hypothetical protein JOB18_037936 [Solea senegalensis]|uniref:Uncharacterized protein n=1 Tax=Solea senegalensis TaxID=28829 RepID=A0AAV6SW53_SOLSE|nr:hypothetical protein JOB18_037936 [Solea senegalensis]
MEDGLNVTIDPACLQEPPLAIDIIKQLDVFELCLYAMLTFMSCISLLLYLEQCVYIYKKLPYPKKTTIIWINGAAPSLPDRHSVYTSFLPARLPAQPSPQALQPSSPLPPDQHPSFPAFPHLK